VKHMHAETLTKMKPATRVKHMQYMESLDYVKTHGLSLATHVKHMHSETPTKMKPATRSQPVIWLHKCAMLQQHTARTHLCGHMPATRSQPVIWSPCVSHATQTHGESMCFARVAGFVLFLSWVFKSQPITFRTVTLWQTC